MTAILFGAGLLVFGSAALLLRHPGYMDAEYYLAAARQLAEGRGFSEPFLWNYLSDPAGLPAPSHTYWQPLASLIALIPMAAFGPSFRAAQLASVVLAGLVPPLTARLASALGAERRAAWLAGGLALLPGFYLPYLVTTDTFAIYALIGGLLFLSLGDALEGTGWKWVLVGGLVGLGHLARADGVLLAVSVATMAVSRRSGGAGRRLLFAAMGYLALMIPWWARNLAVSGAPLAPGAARTLWLLDYDELFLYPASILTGSRWWQAGVSTLLGHRIDSAWAQLQTIVAVNGYVVLLPLTVVGAKARAAHPAARAGAAYAAALLVVMTLVFPFAGARGGFFHSSAALMPLLWALTAVGVDKFVEWVSPRLAWKAGPAWRMLASVALLVAGGLSGWVLAGKAGAFGVGQSFDRNAITYGAVGAALGDQDRSGVVAVNDPPGFYLATGMSAVVIPDGPESGLREVSARYGVGWVVLEANHPEGLDELYRSPSSRPWLAEPAMLLDAAGEPVYLFRVEGD